MKKLEELLKDTDIMKVSQSAAFPFRKSLTEDEIENCIYNAVWRASKMYDTTKGTKLTSYIHRGVKFECLSQKKVNSSGKISIDCVNHIASKKHSGFERVDMIDEISKCEDPMLIYDRFYRNMTVNEIADNLGVCGETVRIRLRKNLKMIKNSIEN